MVESRYNAVERLLTYAHLEPEESKEAAARGVPPYRPAGLAPWPATGELEFREVWMSYRAGLDPVLKGVSFKVRQRDIRMPMIAFNGTGSNSLGALAVFAQNCVAAGIFVIYR